MLALDWLAEDLRRVPFLQESHIDAYLAVTAARLDSRDGNLPLAVPLSPFEILALQTYAIGIDPKDIAETLGKSPATVRSQLKHARHKMRATSTGHAAIEAMRLGLIS